MYPTFWIYLTVIPIVLIMTSVGTSLTVDEIQATGKVLFRALRDSECKVKCKSRKPRIMCGSDGVSYLSKCEVKRARRCEGKNVIIKRKGKCSDKDVPMTKCFQEKREALTSASRSGAKDTFIPECNSDGTFAEIQCHEASGYCWCQSKEGKPFPGTSTKGGKPNCKPKAKTKKVKANPSKKSSRLNRKKGKRKRCTSTERARFNSNLVRVFTEEYNRSMRAFPHRRPANPDPVRNTLEKQVVEWKFTQYDSNSDNVLQRKEVNALRRLVKKFIKPRSCAKRFLKYCDSNRDKLVERREWSLCLGVDINNEQTTTKAPEPEVVDDTGENIDLHKLLNMKRTTTPSKSGQIERPAPSLPITLDDSWTTFSRTRPVSKPKQDRQTNDCETAKKAALIQEADNPDGGTFIPTCTAGGLWARAQCHKSTGYCWCVEEKTGRPISGTSTRGVHPKCDFDEGERNIPGCSYADKQSFLADLLNTLTTEVSEYAISNATDHSKLIVDPAQGIHERAARWKFAMLDVDGSNDLHGKELIAFKETSLKSAQKKYTRKCSRRFIRYCDENGNKKVSMPEWIDCMGITRSASHNMPTNPKRTGKNPFDQYLRDT